MNIEELLTKPYWVVDLLPEQVSADSGGRFPAVEQYYLREPQLSGMRRKFANIILKLNCYYDISVMADPRLDEEEESAEQNPAPERLADLFAGENAAGFMNIFVGEGDILIVSDKCDTCMTIYNPTERALSLIRRLAAAEGLFVWKP